MDVSSVARLLGRRGGLARGRRLSQDARRHIASLGGHARRRSIEAAQRIFDNFAYADVVEALQGGAPAVKRLSRPGGRLPGLYRDPP
jgi:hypothetical protein